MVRLHTWFSCSACVQNDRDQCRPLTLPVCHPLFTCSHLPINPKEGGAYILADPPLQWKCHGATPDVNILPSLLSFCLPHFSLPLPPAPSPVQQLQVSISFFGEKIRNRGWEEDISPTPPGEWIWGSVYVCFIKAMKQSSQHKQEWFWTPRFVQKPSPFLECTQKSTHVFILS